MNSTALNCTKCRSPLTDALFNQGGALPCPACGAQLQIEVFPALFRPVATGRSAEAILIEGESSCFYHPQKKAVTPCDGCGRFLCALCDCELHGQHFCPACLDTGRKKGRIKQLENQRTLYDSVALGLAVLPMLFIYPTIITAPAVIYIVIRFWNLPRSIVHRSKARYVAALVIAFLQIAGWCVFFILRRTNG
jgi:hypothetical protein